jgi:hypothetical protein
VSYHTKEGLLVGTGLLALAAVGYGMARGGALFWAFLALCGIVEFFSVFYFRSRK